MPKPNVRNGIHCAPWHSISSYRCIVTYKPWSGNIENINHDNSLKNKKNGPCRHDGHLCNDHTTGHSLTSPALVTDQWSEGAVGQHSLQMVLEAKWRGQTGLTPRGSAV